MSDIHSVDVEDDQFAYRYDTQLLIDRRDEDLDNIHSIYVDQWDWEKIIDKEERNLETLKEAFK